MTVILLAAALMLTFAPLGAATAWAEDTEAIAVAVTPAAPDDAGEPALDEPEINPDYIRWENGEDFGGIVPEKYLYERDPINVVPRQPRFANVTDVTYDPRTEDASQNALTPAKDQGSFGTCWAFSSIGALEAYVEKQSTGDTNPDFSELHLAFATSKTDNNPYGVRGKVSDGGNVSQAASYFTRQPASGPVAETDDPYSTESNSRNYADTAAKPKAGLVTGMVRIPDLSAGSPGAETSRAYIGQVKKFVQDYGAATVAYHSTQTISTDGAGDGYNKITNGAYIGQYAYHHSGTENSNHAVLIVGWDDDFPATNFGLAAPAGNGAWLIKNSWNSSGVEANGSEDSGYRSFFWMSYYTEIDSVWAVSGYDKSFNGAIYDYMPLYNSHSGFSPAGVGTTVYSANIFDAEDTATKLEKVQVYNINGAANYAVYIAAGNTATAGNNALLAQAIQSTPVSETFEYDGFYTIDVSSLNIDLNANKTFAVVLKTTVSSGNAKTTYTNSSGASSGAFGPGVGYYSADGQSWSGGENNYACAIRAIVADDSGKGWSEQERKGDIIKPTVELSAPTGTIDNMANGSLTLKFNETVAPVPGKMISVYAQVKAYTYDASSNVASPGRASVGSLLSYTIASDELTVVGTGADCTVTIPFEKFQEKNKPSVTLVNFNTNYGNTDQWRAYGVHMETGAFVDTVGNEPDIWATFFHDPDRCAVDGTFYSKSTNPPAVLKVDVKKTEDSGLNGNIAITFHKQIDKTAGGSVVLSPGNITLTNGDWSGGAVQIAQGASYTYTDGNVYTVPFGNLTPGTEYTITVSGFKDPDGNEMAANSSHKFETAEAFVPVSGITGVPTSGTVGTELTLGGTVEPGDATNKTI
ncbi:MAG: Ig-like domain-containing protein, partial [Clostridiales Family XIII bacterium]|nr:Ig-like domain-containing protein [Clostridiales Family XIII bacterium]